MEAFSRSLFFATVWAKILCCLLDGTKYEFPYTPSRIHWWNGAHSKFTYGNLATVCNGLEKLFVCVNPNRKDRVPCLSLCQLFQLLLKLSHLFDFVNSNLATPQKTAFFSLELLLITVETRNHNNFLCAYIYTPWKKLKHMNVSSK